MVKGTETEVKSKSEVKEEDTVEEETKSKAHREAKTTVKAETKNKRNGQRKAETTAAKGKAEPKEVYALSV